MTMGRKPFTKTDPPPVHRRITMDELSEELERNRGLIYQIAHRWHSVNRRLDIEEFVSAVYHGFFKATRLYDKGRGFKFGTYASWWADNEVRKLLDFHDPSIGPGRGRVKSGEDRDRVRVEFSLNRAVRSEDGEEETAEKFAEAPEPEAKPEYPADFWDRVRAVLTVREFQVVEYRFKEDLSYREIGERLDLTRERIRQLLEKSLDKIGRRCDFGECLAP